MQYLRAEREREHHMPPKRQLADVEIQPQRETRSMKRRKVARQAAAVVQTEPGSTVCFSVHRKVITYFLADGHASRRFSRSCNAAIPAQLL